MSRIPSANSNNRQPPPPLLNFLDPRMPSFVMFSQISKKIIRVNKLLYFFFLLINTVTKSYFIRVKLFTWISWEKSTQIPCRIAGAYTSRKTSRKTSRNSCENHYMLMLVHRTFATSVQQWQLKLFTNVSVIQCISIRSQWTFFFNDFAPIFVFWPVHVQNKEG